MRRIALLTCLAMAAVPLASAVGEAETARAAPAHGWTARCGSDSGPGFGWYNVRAYNVGCRKARSVAQEYTFRGFKDRVQHFRCSSVRTGYETSRADCKRRRDGEHKHIRFNFGA